MATLTINFTEGSGADGYIVQYRVKGSSDAYTTVSPNPTTTPVVITGLLANTEYEGTITSNCTGEFNTVTNFYSCTCPTGYSPSSDMLRCEKLETVAPNSTQTNYCVADSRLYQYGNVGTRIYNSGFSNSSIGSYSPPAGDVYAMLTTPVLWKSTGSSDGPVNRAGVWVDSNCDGIKNSLGNNIDTFSITVPGSDYINGVYEDVPFINKTVSNSDASGVTGDITVSGGAITAITLKNRGNSYTQGDTLSPSVTYLGGTSLSYITVDSVSYQKITFSYTYNHTSSSKTIFVGIAGDNEFILNVNGTIVASTTNPSSTANFSIWHVFPVTLLQGTNFFNITGTGDGSVNDSVAMTIYNNTAVELLDATSLSDLTILFSSEQLIGDHTDIVTCPSGYSLDTSGDVSMCKKLTRTNCTGVGT